MATTKTFVRRQLTYSNATSITACEAAPPFPKNFGLTLRARFVAELATSRPRTRLSTPRPVGGAITHGSQSSWFLRASSPSHHSFRQRSTATQENVQREPSQEDIELANHPEPSPRLDPARQLVLDLAIHQEQNVFITGPARSGKSCLLREFVQLLDAKYSQEKVVVAASTGLAHSIGGTNIHDFTSSGIEGLIAHIHKHPTKLERWRTVKALVVDDISMIPAKLLDALDEIARKVRMDDRPFGGIQLILGGDFCQIPPELRDEYSGKPQFCFQAESWRKAMIHTVGLTEVFREDPYSPTC
ncbi:ATP-dependent DNA helicase RRM3 [Lasiodiplodia theobromae]|uniref:ATP-dependent DNA helicase n=1 Tax=Lasiodiplodia theobromae TaxID=45133 RepID=A0A5N5DBQ9_9PEZI|nr:ATP-dependent DNA helicase RRM3 [Lasiodiplodia theobromae]